MDSRVLLPLIIACFVTAPLSAGPITASKPKFDPIQDSEQRAIKVLREWSEECQTFTSVRGDFHRIWYDDIFRLQKHAEGQFGYLGSCHGFFQFKSPKQKLKVEDLKTFQGKFYEYKDHESEEWRWQKTQLIIIHNEQKEYEEIKYDLNSNRLKSLRCLFNIDTMLPFLPGLPNKSVMKDCVENCWLKVLKESDTHIWIAGNPHHYSNYATYFNEFKLYLEKRPLRLLAVQYSYPGRNSYAVYIFSNIEINPLEWDEPDLTEYRKLSERIDSSVLVARKPKEATNLLDVCSDFCTVLFFVIFLP